MFISWFNFYLFFKFYFIFSVPTIAQLLRILVRSGVSALSSLFELATLSLLLYIVVICCLLLCYYYIIIMLLLLLCYYAAYSLKLNFI